jgi:hypothetical protein
MSNQSCRDTCQNLLAQPWWYLSSFAHLTQQALWSRLVVCQADGLHASSLLLVQRPSEWFGGERSNGGGVSLIGSEEVGHVVRAVVLPGRWAGTTLGHYVSLMLERSIGRRGDIVCPMVNLVKRDCYRKQIRTRKVVHREGAGPGLFIVLRRSTCALRQNSAR